MRIALSFVAHTRRDGRDDPADLIAFVVAPGGDHIARDGLRREQRGPCGPELRLGTEQLPPVEGLVTSMPRGRSLRGSTATPGGLCFTSHVGRSSSGRRAPRVASMRWRGWPTGGSSRGIPRRFRRTATKSWSMSKPKCSRTEGGTLRTQAPRRHPAETARRLCCTAADGHSRRPIPARRCTFNVCGLLGLSPRERTRRAFGRAISLCSAASARPLADGPRH